MGCSTMVFWMSFRIFSTFSIVSLVLGHPVGSSFSSDTQPVLKCECHSKTAVQLKECSPKASQSISSASVADLPNFTQNLMKTRCLILPSITDQTKHEVKKALV
jgi:hypothetical protein